MAELNGCSTAHMAHKLVLQENFLSSDLYAHPRTTWESTCFLEEYSYWQSLSNCCVLFQMMSFFSTLGNKTLKFWSFFTSFFNIKMVKSCFAIFFNLQMQFFYSMVTVIKNLQFSVHMTTHTHTLKILKTCFLRSCKNILLTDIFANKIWWQELLYV